MLALHLFTDKAEGQKNARGQCRSFAAAETITLSTFPQTRWRIHVSPAGHTTPTEPHADLRETTRVPPSATHT